MPTIYQKTADLALPHVRTDFLTIIDTKISCIFKIHVNMTNSTMIMINIILFINETLSSWHNKLSHKPNPIVY